MDAYNWILYVFVTVIRYSVRSFRCSSNVLAEVAEESAIKLFRINITLRILSYVVQTIDVYPAVYKAEQIRCKLSSALS